MNTPHPERRPPRRARARPEGRKRRGAMGRFTVRTVLRHALGIALLVLVAGPPPSAGAADKIASLCGSVSCGPTDDDCYAAADFYGSSTSVTADFFGNASVEVDWTLAGSGFYWFEDDFYGRFQAWVGGVTADSLQVHCSADAGDCVRSGTMSFDLDSPNGTTSRTVKVRVRAWGEGEDCNQEVQRSVSVVRPVCLTTLTIDPIYDKSQLDTQITVSGSVSDDGCGATFSDPTSIYVQVKDPQGAVICGAWTGLTSGSFSKTCALPDKKDPLSYGTYIATASYTPNAPSGHDRSGAGTADTETFDRKFVLRIPSPPKAVANYSDFDHYRVAFADWEDWYVYFFELGTSVPGGLLNLQGHLSGAPRGLAFIQFGGASQVDPSIALTEEGSNRVLYLTLDGQELQDYLAPTPQPFGLAFDGEALWIADGVSGALLRCETATGQILRELHPGLGGLADIDWDDRLDPWGKATLLVLVPDPQEGDRVFRLDPDDGAILEEIPLPPSEHYGLTSLNGVVYVADFLTRDFFPLYEGAPSPPDDVSLESDPEMPGTILLSWRDPGPEPPWDEIRVYRNGTFLDEVAAGEGEYLDEGLTEHDLHAYFLTSVRLIDGTESAPSDTVEGFVGSRPPRMIRVPADHPSVQEGILAASDGDTVEVGIGTWAAPIRFAGRSVLVMSAAGPDETVLDGAGYPLSLVVCDSTLGPESGLSGFTVTGGTYGTEPASSSADPTPRRRSPAMSSPGMSSATAVERSSAKAVGREPLYCATTPSPGTSSTPTP